MRANFIALESRVDGVIQCSLHKILNIYQYLQYMQKTMLQTLCEESIRIYVKVVFSWVSASL